MYTMCSGGQMLMKSEKKTALRYFLVLWGKKKSKWEREELIFLPQLRIKCNFWGGRKDIPLFDHPREAFFPRSRDGDFLSSVEIGKV